MLTTNADSNQRPKSLSSADVQIENERLAQKYCPLLVLFPEIKPGSKREEHHHAGHCLGSAPPLDQDYHPRDINLVLDNAHLPVTGIFKYLRYLGIRKGKTSREQLLTAMSENKIKYIDIIDEHGPNDVNKFWRVYAGIPERDNNPKYARKAYARVIRGSGRFEHYVSIQYWLAYFFNDFANVHEMDWEMISVILKVSDSKEEPIACAYNAHMASFRKPWQAVDKVDKKYNEKVVKNPVKNPFGLHPVAYIANGSHASYFSDYPSSFDVVEEHLKPILQKVVHITSIGASLGFTEYVPGFDDENTVKCFPEIEIIPEPEENGKWTGNFRWLNFEGHWGSSPNLPLRYRIPLLGKIFSLSGRPIQDAGPTGPNKGHGSCWNKPFEWINQECLDIEDTVDWIWL